MSTHEHIKFGRPLPSFQNEDDSGKKLLVHKTRHQRLNDPTQYKHDLRVQDQIVTDEQGRRRFHGAFTGGFSAGYYNTVGTEKGWKPNSVFDRSKKQSIDDFLDDEDRSEFGIQPKALKANEGFNPNASSREPRGPQGGASIDGYSHNIAPKLTEIATIGIRILRTMGYIENQSSKTLAHIDRTAVIKRKLILAKCNNDLQASLDLLEEKMKIESACVTKTTDEFILPKSNDQTFGLGYKKLSGLMPSKQVSSSVRSSFGGQNGNGNSSKKSKFGATSKSQKMSISGGFGVGAFEEEDDDIYGQDSIANYDIDLTIRDAQKSESGGPGLAIGNKHDQEDDGDYSLLALGYNDGVLFKPAKKAKRFERFTNELAKLRPDIPRNWKPKVPIIKKTHNLSKEDKYKKQKFMSNTINRKRALEDEQDKIDERREKQRQQMLEWEKSRQDQLEQQKEKIEKEKQEKKEALLKSIFSNKFVHATGDSKANDENDPEKLAKKVATLKIQTWSPHNTLCKRFNVPNPGVIDEEQLSKNYEKKEKSEEVTKMETYSNKKSHFGSVLPLPSDMVEDMQKEKNGIKQENHDNNDKMDVDDPPESEEEDTETTRPTMDTFAAIFGDDSDDQDDDENEDDDEILAQNPHLKTLNKKDREEARNHELLPTHLKAYNKTEYQDSLEMKSKVESIFDKYLSQIKRKKEIEEVTNDNKDKPDTPVIDLVNNDLSWDNKDKAKLKLDQKLQPARGIGQEYNQILRPKMVWQRQSNSAEISWKPGETDDVGKEHLESGHLKVEESDSDEVVIKSVTWDESVVNNKKKKKEKKAKKSKSKKKKKKKSKGSSSGSSDEWEAV